MGIWLPGRCRPLAQTELRAERAEQWLVLIRREIEDNLMDVFNPREAMTDPTITELEQRITMLRQNINELINRPLRTLVLKMKTEPRTGSRSKSKNCPG